MRNLPIWFLAFSLVACNDPPTPSPTCDAAGSERAGAADRAKSNNQFALALEAQLSSMGGNVFFSPYSLSVALGMVYEGARGASASALAQTAGFDPDAGVTGLGFAQLACALTDDAAQGGNQLSVGDALFSQKGTTLLPSYVAALQTLYAAPATLVDFVGNPAAAAQTIDDWVSKATQGTIPKLISESDIDPLTRLILVNAVYFHGTWANGFDPSRTMAAPFTTEAGTTAEIPTMNTTLTAGLAGGSAGEPTVLELPYKGGGGSDPVAALVLDVILPPRGTSLSSFEQGLTLATLEDLLGKVLSSSVDVAMPKLALDPRYDLGSNLAKMGLGPLFDSSQADLSGIDGQKDLFVQGIIQQAHLVVDETGTVASAATAVSFGTTAYEGPALVQVDRPFLLILRDVPTGAFLFYGRVADPSQT